MKVMQVYRDYFTDLPGGIERHIYDLAHGLGPDVQSEVLVSGRERSSTVEMDEEVIVHLHGRLARIQGIPISPGFSRAMRRRDIDVLHLHSPNPGAEFSFMARKVRTPTVLTYHCDLGRGGPIRPLHRSMLYRMLGRVDRVVVSTDRLISSSPLLTRFAKERPEKMDIVPFGVNPTRFTPFVDPMLSGVEPIVLFLGRVRYYKGLGVLVRAMADVPATLVVAGGGPSARELINFGKRRLGHRFVWLGSIPDELLPAVYRSAAVFCLPSTTPAEAFGIAALESMASGTPVITTEVGTGTSVINQDGVTGLVVPPSDPDALRRAIVKMLEQESMRKEMGEAARQRVEDHYTLEKMFAAMRDVYARATR